MMVLAKDQVEMEATAFIDQEKIVIQEVEVIVSDLVDLAVEALVETDSLPNIPAGFHQVDTTGIDIQTGDRLFINIRTTMTDTIQMIESLTEEALGIPIVEAPDILIEEVQDIQ